MRFRAQKGKCPNNLWPGLLFDSEFVCLHIMSPSVKAITCGKLKSKLLFVCLFIYLTIEQYFEQWTRLMFINDPPTNITSGIKLFADDCVLYRPLHSVSDHLTLQRDRDQLEKRASI